MKIRRLNEDAKRFYVDEIVSTRGGKTETERHSFSTIEELKQYCKDAGLTKDDIANCGGCDVKDLYESYVDVKIPKIIKERVDELCDAINDNSNDEYDDDEDDGGPRTTEYGYNANLWDRGTGRNYRVEDGKPSSYYADEVMEIIMEEFAEILDTHEKELAVYCYVEFGEEPEWVEDSLQEEIEKLHTKPNGEYLVKADSGKGYTAFSRDNVAIGGIDNEDADSDDKAIDKFKRNEYSECLNEAYFDTAEYRIQKYEDDIPELMAGMHDDYMEGKLDAARYAEVLKKVYDALAECDYKHTMSAPVVTNGSGKRVLDALAKLDKTNEALGIGAGLALGGAAIGAGMVGSALLDSVEDENKEEETELNELFDIEIDAKGFGGSGNNVHVGPGSMPLTSSVEENEDDKTLNEESEKYYAAKYTSVDDSGNQIVKKICFRCDGTIEDAENEVDALIKEPYTSVRVFSCNKSMAVKDGFELVECTLNEDKETVSKFAQLAASHKFKNLKTQLEDADTCVTCQGKLLPEDNNGIRKCESCGNFYFGNQLLICTKCGSTEIDPGRECKCRHCGYEFTEDHGKCVTCGGDIVKNNNETNKCQHCGNLYDVKTGKLIKKKTNEAVEYDEDNPDTWPWKERVEYEQDKDWGESYFLDDMFSDVADKAFAIVEAEGYTDVFTEPSTQVGQGADFYWATKDGVRYTGRHDFQDQEAGFWSCCEEANSKEEAIELMAKYYASNILSALEPDEEDYDDDYSNEYDESLEECSGIKAHKVIMGEDIDDSIEFDDVDGVEGPEGDKTEDIEFVMDEYIAPDFLIDAVNKLSPTKYEVTYNGKTVLLEFDPKWAEYVYTINGRGPHSHSSYEWIISDIRDYVNTFCADEDGLDDDF